ncbi:MAG: transglycosylase SLT domain-containing protein [Proteobacteria bacterium]|nr:transglycosylase SLT domain-containing protein [Pseudomonadota bacterium]
MNSTRGRAARRGMRWLWAVLLMPLAVARAPAADSALPYPPQLQRDVNFWVRVYTRIDTNSGYLHDQYNLSVIYDTLHFAPDSSPRARQLLVNRTRDRYIAQLRQIALGKGPLSPQEARIKSLWGAKATRARLLEATHDIRFQLGQSNRFKAGLIRAGAWQHAIARALREEGLPPQLAALPLVESSYNPRAYSRVGAAGLWQFMPGTGRRYMQIGRAVDDRMDPFMATKAAAQLLAYNYRILGTWPLALTAYNHGLAGMRRAVQRMGTTNIVTIVRHYHTRMFGFASRNFYVSFLAALKIDRDPQKYFGSIVPMREERFREVKVPEYVDIGPLEHALDINSEALRDLNPALRPAVWRGWLAVPRGYELRLPLQEPTLTTAMLASRLSTQTLLARAATPRRAAPRMRAVRTEAHRFLAAVVKSAHASDVAPAPALAQAPAAAYDSRVSFAPAPPAAAGFAASMPDGDASPERGSKFGLTNQGLLAYSGLGRASQRPRAAPDSMLMSSQGAGSASPGYRPSVSGDTDDEQPVSAAQEDAMSPSLGPADGSSQNEDPTDYSVAPNGTIAVAAAESLGYYAEWLGVSAWDLRRLNHLSFRQPVRIGERIRLDFRYVSPQAFEAQRVNYHRALEASYFAAHRIAGTEPYVARRGDSLWTVTQRFSQMPLWLLREYNPDTDFADLRPGTQLVVPRVEEVSGGGA